MSCQLYRHWDAEDRLLYVGISLSAVARFQQHKQSAGWFADVAKITIENFPTRELALAAEGKCIRKEKPLYNKAGAVREHRVYVLDRGEVVGEVVSKSYPQSLRTVTDVSLNTGYSFNRGCIYRDSDGVCIHRLRAGRSFYSERVRTRVLV